MQEGITITQNKEVSRIRSAGEPVILAYGFIEIIWSIIRQLRGSNPQTRRQHMAKHNQARVWIKKGIYIRD